MFIDYKKFETNRCFGVELEVSSVKINKTCRSTLKNAWTDKEGVGHPKIQKEDLRNIIQTVSDKDIRITDWAQTSNNSYWHVKYDSTCGPLGKNKDQGGWEVASFKAKGIRDLQHIGKVADALNSAGVEVNNNCGFHIHVDASDFLPKHVAVTVARWLKIEPWICRMLPPHRRKNKYCKLLNKYFKHLLSVPYDAEDFWQVIKPSNLDIHENPQKKVALNLVNYISALYNEQHVWCDATQNRKTIELRLPEGTLQQEEIIHWVMLFLLFVDISKKHPMPNNFKEATLDEFMACVGLEEGEGCVLARDLFDLKKWIFHRMIKWGGKKYGIIADKNLQLMNI
jgi:hypothetical protein